MKRSRRLWVLFAAQLNCINGPLTPQAVDQWRKQAADALVQETMSESSLTALIKRCFGTEVPACLARLNDYAGRENVGAPALDPPVRSSAPKQPPPELFLNGGSAFEYRVAPDLEARAAAQGWPAVRYKSRHSGGFDPATPSLLMVLVPGDKVNPPVAYDRWLNFALPADGFAEAMDPVPSAAWPSADDYAAEGRGEDSLPKVFTMVSLDRRQGNTPGQVYFQRFLRQTLGDPTFRPEAVTNPRRCIGCHPNGLRAISPLGYHVRKEESMMDEESWRAVKQINDAMVQSAGTRVVSWREAPVIQGGSERRPLLNPAAHGPEIGPVKPLNGRSRTASFIAQCAQQRREVAVRDIFGRAPGQNNVYRLSSNPQIDANKILRFMSCGSCHGTAQRGALNTLTDWAQIDFKILVDQSMPFGAHKNPLESNNGEVQDTLTPDERMALANCLLAEFKLESKEMTAWLTQGQCQE